MCLFDTGITGGLKLSGTGDREQTYLVSTLHTEVFKVRNQFMFHENIFGNIIMTVPIMKTSQVDFCLIHFDPLFSIHFKCLVFTITPHYHLEGGLVVRRKSGHMYIDLFLVHLLSEFFHTPAYFILM